MNWASEYRNNKVEYDSDDGRVLEIQGFHPATNNTTGTDTVQLQSIISGSVSQTLAQKEARPTHTFRTQLNEFK